MNDLRNGLFISICDCWFQSTPLLSCFKRGYACALAGKSNLKLFRAEWSLLARLEQSFLFQSSLSHFEHTLVDPSCLRDFSSKTIHRDSWRPKDLLVTSSNNFSNFSVIEGSWRYSQGKGRVPTEVLKQYSYKILHINHWCYEPWFSIRELFVPKLTILTAWNPSARRISNFLLFVFFENIDQLDSLVFYKILQYGLREIILNLDVFFQNCIIFTTYFNYQTPNWTRNSGESQIVSKVRNSSQLFFKIIVVGHK